MSKLVELLKEATLDLAGNIFWTVGLVAFSGGFESEANNIVKKVATGALFVILCAQFFMQKSKPISNPEYLDVQQDDWNAQNDMVVARSTRFKEDEKIRIYSPLLGAGALVIDFVGGIVKPHDRAISIITFFAICLQFGAKGVRSISQGVDSRAEGGSLTKGTHYLVGGLSLAVAFSNIVADIAANGFNQNQVARYALLTGAGGCVLLAVGSAKRIHYVRQHQVLLEPRF